MAHIFISYSKHDLAFAHHLRAQLQRAGFGVWMDEQQLTPSERWWPTIEDTIETSAAVIVIMSPHSRESDWVEREILYAEQLGKPIFPVLLAGTGWPRLANIQYADMRGGVGASVPDRLLNGLRAVVPSAAQQTARAARQAARAHPAGARAQRQSGGCLGRLVLVGIVVALLVVGLVATREQTGLGDWLGDILGWDRDDQPEVRILAPRPGDRFPPGAVIWVRIATEHAEPPGAVRVWIDEARLIGEHPVEADHFAFELEVNLGDPGPHLIRAELFHFDELLAETGVEVVVVNPDAPPE